MTVKSTSGGVGSVARLARWLLLRPVKRLPSPLVLGLGSLLTGLRSSHRASLATLPTPPEVDFTVIAQLNLQRIQEEVHPISPETVDGIPEAHPLHRPRAQRAVGPRQMLHHARRTFEPPTFSPIHEARRFRSESMNAIASGQKSSTSTCMICPNSLRDRYVAVLDSHPVAISGSKPPARCHMTQKPTIR